MLQDRLRELRQSLGLSQQKLSLLAGLTASHVGLIEQNRIDNVSTDTAAALAKVLGCSLDWLVSGDGEPPSLDVSQEALAAARESVAGDAA